LYNILRYFVQLQKYFVQILLKISACFGEKIEKNKKRRRFEAMKWYVKEENHRKMKKI